eukprot:CAMPEP_0202399080 /NCGR_PEP_ID=MMETSP1128-20130828/1766_1 /ASSEMBLY_ACC=CAM_ASM_000463 /TAXON_ID=3047 /ORGANISM="Dunaliella tertiolecta, Strain CCMP1320" /LENGTH=70 /DNA_ID=CAMNT_0049002345 /DNA_START=25 /DNA_END=234 /DNA_ORIENTATION=+
MASQAPSSSSNPLTRWLKPVSPTQQLLATQNKLAMAQAAKKGQPVQQKNPVGVLQVTARLMLHAWAPVLV